METDARLAAACATVLAFAESAGAERVALLLDTGDETRPVLVEVDGGALEVTDGATSAPLPVPDGGAPHALPHLHRVPATALTADPDTGELGAPLGTVQMLADAVMGLARAVGGRSVATATFATRDPGVPLTVAAREGEPVVLDLAGRHFALPAGS